MKLHGRVAIVTGASGGIGHGIALKLAQEGADVAATDIRAEAGNAVVAELLALGRRATFIRADVTKSDQVSAMVTRVLNDYSRVDILVNCVGGSGGRAELREMSEELWDLAIAINLKATFNCCRAVIGSMIEQRGGKIVNIASMAGTGAYTGMAHYCAGKAGVIAMTRVLAAEVAGYGINVNCVSPGTTATPPVLGSPERWQASRKNASGFGRLARVEEIANTVAFLASDEASFTTGQDYAVCGTANLVSW